MASDDMPDFSNVKSGACSTATRNLRGGVWRQPVRSPNANTVMPTMWKQILETNDIIKDPNLIYPGQQLKLPPLVGGTAPNPTGAQQ